MTFIPQDAAERRALGRQAAGLVVVSIITAAAGRRSGVQMYQGADPSWLWMLAEILVGSAVAYAVIRRWREPAAAAMVAAGSYLPWYGLGASWMAYIGYLLLPLEACFVACAVKILGKLSWERAWAVALLARGAGLLVRFAKPGLL